MLFFFGWGHKKVEEHGPIYRKLCSNCGNTSFWHLYTISTWFELFFFPVIPYDKEQVVLCPICGNSVKLHDLQFMYYETIANLNTQYSNSEITKEEYIAAAKELNHINE